MLLGVVSRLRRYSNCWLWAMAMARRRAKRGRESYIVRRRTRHPFALRPAREFVPHYLYAERRASGTLRVVSYVPTHDGSKDIVILFRGRVRWGDHP
jgi:hypothetical protein